MPRVRRFMPILVILVLAPPVAWGQERPDLETRSEVIDRLNELLRARRGAFVVGQDDAADVLERDPRRPAITSPRVEAIDSELRRVWGKVFEAQVFGNPIGDAGAREHLARTFESRLAGIDKSLGLSHEEGEKLRLAAGGDAKRYLGRCGEARRRYEDADAESFMRPVSRDELVSLKSEFDRGPFGEGSLFAKVLAKILADREAAGVARP